MEAPARRPHAPSGTPLMSNAAYARSRHAVWLSAATLFHDTRGHVLIVDPTYHTDRWLLPGGGAEPGETPRQAAERETREEIGLHRPVTQVLAVDWCTPDTEDVPADMPFPGCQFTVFDGGLLADADIARIRLDMTELSDHAFVPVEEAAARMIPPYSRCLRAAHRAKLDGRGPAILENGRPLVPERPAPPGPAAPTTP